MWTWIGGQYDSDHEWANIRKRPKWRIDDCAGAPKPHLRIMLQWIPLGSMLKTSNTIVSQRPIDSRSIGLKRLKLVLHLAGASEVLAIWKIDLNLIGGQLIVNCSIKDHWLNLPRRLELGNSDCQSVLVT